MRDRRDSLGTEGHDVPLTQPAAGYRGANLALLLILLVVPSGKLPADLVVAAKPMSTPRVYHTSTLLPDGRVLVAGGDASSSVRLGSAELFDPVTGTFAPLGTMTSVRSGATATLLLNGLVLITGGGGLTSINSSAELFDPSSRQFRRLSSSLTTPRSGHSATLLPSGLVLLAGGWQPVAPTASAELYDPASETFVALPNSMIYPRMWHTATLLADGDVLLAGGNSTVGWIDTAEVFHPVDLSFRLTASPMTTLRAFHTATRLADGSVVVAGGNSGGFEFLFDADLYDPISRSFVRLGNFMKVSRAGHSATLLPSGKVLIAGGTYGDSPFEEFDPVSRTFAVSTAGIVKSRDWHTATLLADGRVLIAGGRAGGIGAEASAQVFIGGTPLFSPGPSTTEPRYGQTLTPLPDGRILVAGGALSSASAETYAPVQNSFTLVGPMTTPRRFHTATLLPTGKVLLAGGDTGSGLTNTAELFDPVSNTFSATGAMRDPRWFHSAVLLSDGLVFVNAGGGGGAAEIYDWRSETFSPNPPYQIDYGLQRTATLLRDSRVLLTGGTNPYTGVSDSAEIYDPLLATFRAVSPMLRPRTSHTATLLHDGRVLVAGGDEPAEIFDPASETFSAAGLVWKPGREQAATLLSDGSVLLTGGLDASVTTARAVIYEPISETFTTIAPMTLPRNLHSAVGLPDGRVLIVGGTTEIGLLSQTEIFDAGSGPPESRRPSITSSPTELVQPTQMTILGSGFRGDSEGSGGFTTTESATNYPILRLERVEGGVTATIPWDPTVPVSDTSVTSAPVWGLPLGHYRTTVSVIGVQSLPRMTLFKAPTAPLRLFTLNPCRVVDTRNADGPFGGPILSAGPSARVFSLASSSCGVPRTARAVAINVTVSGADYPGAVTVLPPNLTSRVASWDAYFGRPERAGCRIAFSSGQTRALNGVCSLASDGSGTLAVVNDSLAHTHFILDISGYFAEPQ